MVIVAVIVAIAAWIAVPNFLEAQMRTKASNHGTVLRMIATAIEMYFNDHRTYPPTQRLADSAADPGRLKKAGGTNLTTLRWSCLTTPVCYLDRSIVTEPIPSDPFAPGKGTPWGYYTDGAGWILFSCMGDGHYDIRPVEMYDGTKPQPPASLLAVTYDPTNGASSRGDLWRIKQ